MTPDPPFFVVGAQRSGTTMLRLMLNTHSDVAVPFESDFLCAAEDDPSAFDAKASLRRMAQDPWTSRARIIGDKEAILARNPTSYAELVHAIFEIWSASQGKRRWGIKTPGYVVEIDTLNRFFPDSRFVHIVRDGRDVAVSLAGLSWGGTHIPRIAADWRWKTVLGHKMGSILGPRYLEIRYEDLVVDPRTTLSSICSFLCIAYEEGMLDYPETALSAMPSESLQWHRSSVSAPDKNKIGQWRTRLSYADKLIFEQVAGDALAMFGYDCLSLKPTMSSRLKNAYYSLIKRW